MLTKKTLTTYIKDLLNKIGNLQDSSGSIIDQDDVKLILYQSIIINLLHHNWYHLSSFQLAKLSNFLSTRKSDDLWTSKVLTFQNELNLVDIDLKTFPLEIPYEKLTSPLLWTYFNESLPFVKKYFQIHHGIFLESEARSFFHKLTKSKVNKITSGDLQALKLLIDKATKAIEDQALPNKGKILMYHLPKYESDLIKGVEEAKKTKKKLEDSLKETFHANGQVNEELLSNEIKSRD